MLKDNRIKNNHDLVRDIENKSYLDLFSKHQFTRINKVINWLNIEFHKRFTGRVSDRKISFEDSIGGNEIFNVISEGDIFYCSVFDSENLLQENYRDLEKPNPLSMGIEKVYNSIWGFDNLSASGTLVIYIELEKYLEHLLGMSIAVDARYKTFSDWLKISSITHGMWSFYEGWTSDIDKKLILDNISDLLDIGTSVQLHNLSEAVGYSNKKEDVSEAYENKLRMSADKSEWQYVKELTHDSGLFFLNDDLSLKERLLLRLEISHWLKWMDSLKWPILQDHVFSSIEDLAVLEHVIEILLRDEIKLKSNLLHLLLIALKNYYELIEKITFNLFSLKEGEWSYHDDKIKQQIIDSSQLSLDNWIQTELEASCDRIFHFIFKGEPVSSSENFIGVFEWINSYSQQSKQNVRPPEPGLMTLKIFTEVFEKFLVADSAVKINIDRYFKVEKLNWQIFERLVFLFQSDESDSVFRDSVYDKYVKYLNAETFNWNSGLEYADVFINQAFNLAYVITKSPEPFSKWNILFNEFRLWNEGWSTSNLYDQKARSKEIYLLLVGACLSYSFYYEGEDKLAKDIFEEVLKKVISQYRVSISHNSPLYEFVLRFMTHTVAKFTPQNADDFIKMLNDKCDDIELFLILVSEITNSIDKSDLCIGAASISLIKDRINKEFWNAECRYAHSGLKYKLNYFLNLKMQVLKNL